MPGTVKRQADYVGCCVTAFSCVGASKVEGVVTTQLNHSDGFVLLVRQVDGTEVLCDVLQALQMRLKDSDPRVGGHDMWGNVDAKSLLQGNWI